MSNEDYASWLGLAQQTAWREYAKINPRAKSSTSDILGAAR